jgi:hypothetical protein
VTTQQAYALVAQLVDAYPTSRKARVVSVLDTLRGYLAPLDATIAEDAIRDVIESSPWFPSVADVANAYSAARRRHIVARRGTTIEALPEPTDAEREAMLAQARRFAERRWGS